MFKVNDKVKLSSNPSPMTKLFYERFPEYVNNTYVKKDGTHIVVKTEQCLDGVAYYLKDIPWIFRKEDLESV